MGNALSAGMPPPPPPDIPQSPQQDGAPGQQPQMPQQMPAPSHAQTVAALRHFHSIMTELQGIIKNPDLGKADMKSAIIDGATKLVASRIIPATQAVMQLATVPERPFEQKKWVMMQFMQAQQAMDVVLEHHGMSNPATGDLANEMGADRGSPDNHISTMAGLMQAHYGQGPR